MHGPMSKTRVLMGDSHADLGMPLEDFIAKYVQPSLDAHFAEDKKRIEAIEKWMDAKLGTHLAKM